MSTAEAVITFVTIISAALAILYSMFWPIARTRHKGVPRMPNPPPPPTKRSGSPVLRIECNGQVIDLYDCTVEAMWKDWMAGTAPKGTKSFFAYIVQRLGFSQEKIKITVL